MGCAEDKFCFSLQKAEFQSFLDTDECINFMGTISNCSKSLRKNPENQHEGVKG